MDAARTFPVHVTVAGWARTVHLWPASTIALVWAFAITELVSVRLVTLVLTALEALVPMTARVMVTVCARTVFASLAGLASIAH